MTDNSRVEHHRTQFSRNRQRAGKLRVASRFRRYIATWGAISLLIVGVSCTNGDATSCSDSLSCTSGYECQSGSCVAISRFLCTSPADCGGGETCTATGVCRPGSCFIHGCVDGYICAVTENIHLCSAIGDAASPDAASDAQAGTEAGTPDASVATDASATPDSSTDSGIISDSSAPDSSATADSSADSAADAGADAAPITDATTGDADR